jgi:glycosyltransferase involved in cell wall biosynthesis
MADLDLIAEAVSQPLRIAVYHNLPSGGAKRTLHAILKRLSERHQLDLYDLSCSNRDFCDVTPFVGETFTYPFNPLPELRRPLGRLNFGARLLDLFRLESLQRRIAADIDRRGYDVVYVHPCQFTQTPALLRFLQTPSLYHSREPLRASFSEPIIDRPYHRPRQGVHRLLDNVDLVAHTYRRRLQGNEQLSSQCASLVVTNSYFTREALYRFYGVNARVCYHGVDSEVFRPLDLSRDGRVLSVGALTPAKGFAFIIQSLALIPASARPGLTIVSNYQVGDELAYLNDLAEKCDVSVEFRTMISNKELVRLYNTAPAVVYAPIMEPFGLVALEAMACGTPVVAVCEGGVRESVTNGQTGLLVDRDPWQFAQAVGTLIKDRQLANRYGKQARECVLSRWRWADAICKLESYLLQAQRSDRA